MMKRHRQLLAVSLLFALAAGGDIFCRAARASVQTTLGAADAILADPASLGDSSGEPNLGSPSDPPFAAELFQVASFDDEGPEETPSAALSAMTADFDNNGRVDGLDLGQWTGDFGGGGSDANGDGRSDGFDFLMWQRQLGATAGPSVSHNPEPATLAVWGVLTSVGGLVYALRRRRS